MKAAVRDVKSKLSMYGDLAHNGQTVVVCKHGKPWFNLVPHQKPERKITPLKGVAPVISEADAVKPVAEKDIPGWM